MDESVIQKSFRKIRLKKQKTNPKLDNLFSEELKSKIAELESKDNASEHMEELFTLDEKYEKVIEEISSICALKNKEFVNEFPGRSDTLEGYNQIKSGI